MMKRVFWSIAVVGIGLAGPPALASAQQPTTITGRVRADATPLQGALVSIPALSIGGYTDATGLYSFSAPATAMGRTVVLTARRIGYAPDSVQVVLSGGTVERDINLTVAATRLTGVVVTALGVERERAQLGTAQQQITTEDLNTTKAMNLVQQVQGKISGVTITGGGTPGGSTNIIIRGQNTFSSSNQPLFIVDNIPVSNSNRGGGLGNGYDFGNAISDLNPEDIESMTVLKGPNAAAIYGSRAQNGAIVITTKKGMATDGRMRMEVSSLYTWEKIGRLPDYQNRYGQGAGGSFAFVDGAGAGDCDYCDQSWGPMLDGRPIDQFTGPQQPWVPRPNNVESFFETGHTMSTTVSAFGGTERANARMSFGVDNTDGFVPNNTFQKVNGLLSGELKISPKFTTDAVLQYVRNNGKNRPGTGYNNSILQQFYWFGRQVDVGALKNYDQGATVNNGPAGREFNWNYLYHNNPYFIQNETNVEDSRDRFIVQGSATYAFTDWLSASLRSGSDIFRLNIDQTFPGNFLNTTYVNSAYEGGYWFINDYRNEHNTELLVNANRALGTTFQVNAMLGGNVRREYFNTTSQQTGGITVAGIYNPSNAAIAPTLAQTINRRHMNSVYGSIAGTFRDFWTVEATGRNDYSSTLPKGENSYFYPSINTSVVLTDAMPAFQTDFMSFLKLRASWAEVGNDADPYRLATTFTGLADKFGGRAQFSLGDQLLEPNLKPEITRSTEFGLEAAFLDSRATIDLTVYNKYTRNQIYLVPVSSTSGYAQKLLNAGEMQNSGFEALLSATPVQTGNLTWTATANYAKNKNKVADLAPGVELIVLGNGLFGDARVEARKGQPFGAIWGGGFARCDDTAIDDGSCTESQRGIPLIEDGLPIVTDTFVYHGSIQPKWTGGLHNQLTYKNVSLGVLLDIRRGGKLMSYSNYVGTYSGVLKSTLKGREVDWDDPGIVARGIDVDTAEPNEVNVTAEEYYQGLFFNVEPFVYDASYTKLRELRIGFEIPPRWLGRLNIETMSLALTGRNLYMWTDVPNIDPEFTYSSGNNQGMEYAFPGNTRSFGINVRITP